MVLSAAASDLSWRGRLANVIASPDRLADEKIWQAAKDLLLYAQGVTPAGPRLSAQVEDLDRLPRRAIVPVAVQFASDNETDVVIYKVGKLGRFSGQDCGT